MPPVAPCLPDRGGRPWPLQATDTIEASDHLPVHAWLDIPITTEPMPGDANADKVVDGADYTIWADNYGTGGGSSVPEPVSFGLLALGGLAVLRRRR